MSSVLTQVQAAKPRPLVSRLLTAVLRHPVAVALKRPIRDLVWAFKASGVENPAVPDDARSMVFVCLGNICRSPFAALLAAARLEAEGETAVRCVSAGIRPSQAARSPQGACDAAASYGLSMEAHQPQLLTQELMDAADMIVVMELAQLMHLRATYPAHRDRIFLLSLLDTGGRGAYERYNIVDPFGHPRIVFDDCYRRIARAVDALITLTRVSRPR